MKVELSRKSLEILVKGSEVHFSEFDNLLVRKAGHSYSDQYSRTFWQYLSHLTDEELFQLHLICLNSWIK